jgi:hypothetical protein
VRDSFPINYGSGGIGSEIIANRLGVGPMWDCAECKYEEFFLASSVVGDPAMIVDIPANTTDGAGNIIPGAKATKALYPDDPSNVHHAYLSDRVKFRNLHAGPKEHHIFHLHAHQWLFNPDDPQSSYLDGQAIGPGSGYTFEIAYGGSGNRNKTAGDSIFHCHFYPHFAQGMWELWRVHDSFEQGTLMDIDPDDGLPIPAAGSRALPDGEIVAGTPIPGVVPIPTNAMAPMPDAAATIVASDLNGDGTYDSSQFDANGDGFADIFQLAGADLDDDGVGDPLTPPATSPGYPWFIPTLMGHRPPTPAMDMDPDGDGSSAGYDGGLPRHIVTSGPDEDNPDHAGAPVEMYVSRLDFNKVLHEASAIQIPEDGTATEKVAMDFHAQQFWPSFKPDGTAANFETNGLPPVAGAPFADPCRTDPNGAGNVANIAQNRTIKGANIEMPIVLNKVGWHEQHRLRRVPAHQPGAQRLPARRLPGAHADRHHRPAHPPGQVRRDERRRLGQRLQLRGRHPEPRRGARAHRCFQQRRRIYPAGRHGDHRPGAGGAPLLRRHRPRRPELDGRADHDPALVRRPLAGALLGRRRGHGLYPRPLRPLDPPAGGPVLHPADRARRLHLAAQRDRGPAGHPGRRRTHHLAGHHRAR